MHPFRFIGFWIVSTLIIIIVSQLSPQEIVLGNQHILPIWASVLAGFILSTMGGLTEQIAHMFKISKTEKLKMFALTVVVFSLSVWTITRFALLIGVGISHFWWAGILGTILTLGLWLVVSVLPKK